MNYFPQSQIFGKADTHGWTQGCRHPLFCLDEALFVSLFKALPQLLFETPDMRVVEGTAPDHVSTLHQMHRINQSFAQLGDRSPTVVQLATKNECHLVACLHICSMHLITNHSHKSPNFPRSYMSPPKTKYQREMDHELKHFSACYTSNYGLTGALDVKKFVKHCRRNEGLVKYIMFKRAFSMTNQSLVENLKKHGTGITNALHRKLVHLRRRSYNNTTPANAWKLLFCRLPATILKNRVYSNTMMWWRDGMKGMMVNQFIVMWPLFLAGHVDRLDDPEKIEMA